MLVYVSLIENTVSVETKRREKQVQVKGLRGVMGGHSVNYENGSNIIYVDDTLHQGINSRVKVI